MNSRYPPPYSGIWPAMVTPFDAQDRVNLAAVRQLVARAIAEGAGGVYLCGSTAEAPLLRMEERMAIAECVVSEAAGRLPMIVHVGQTSPVLAVELARHAARIGADAVSSTLPPFYAYTPAQVAEYWSSIAQAAELPFYGYVMNDIGQSEAGVAAWVSTMQRIPMLAGVKFTNESAYQLALLKRCSEGRLNVLSGADQAFLACRAQGADGAIGTTYNVALPLWAHVSELYDSGDTAAAAEAMMRCAQLIGRFNSGYFLAMIKEVLRRQGIDCGSVRSPLRPTRPIPEGEVERIMEMLDALLAEVAARRERRAPA